MPRVYTHGLTLTADDIAEICGDNLPPPPRPDVFAVPTVLDLVRSAPPSEALVGFLASSTCALQREGKTDLAAELLSIALCARSALREGRPLG
jgi:hypothetical protein